MVLGLYTVFLDTVYLNKVNKKHHQFDDAFFINNDFNFILDFSTL
jgi:hypothetical protein